MRRECVRGSSTRSCDITDRYISERLKDEFAQGTADFDGGPQVTKRFAKELCAKGERVAFVELPGVSHIFVARDAAPTAIK